MNGHQIPSGETPAPQASPHQMNGGPNGVAPLGQVRDVIGCHVVQGLVHRQQGLVLDSGGHQEPVFGG